MVYPFFFPCLENTDNCTSALQLRHAGFLFSGVAFLVDMTYTSFCPHFIPPLQLALEHMCIFYILGLPHHLQPHFFLMLKVNNNKAIKRWFWEPRGFRRWAYSPQCLCSFIEFLVAVLLKSFIAVGSQDVLLTFGDWDLICERKKWEKVVLFVS